MLNEKIIKNQNIKQLYINLFYQLSPQDAALFKDRDTAISAK